MGPDGPAGPVASERCLTLPLADPPPVWGQAEAVRLYAAAASRGAFPEMVGAFAAAYGVPVEAAFGASGLLRLQPGEPNDVFADRARRLAMFIRSPEDQAILARHGFTTPTSSRG
jgi:ABC-type molybdate transport system substrate-binding protein